MEGFRGRAEIVDVYGAGGVGDDQLVLDGGEGEDFVGLGEDAGWWGGSGGAGVEEAHGFVPGAGDECVEIGVVAEAFDGLIVGTEESHAAGFGVESVGMGSQY